MDDEDRHRVYNYPPKPKYLNLVYWNQPRWRRHETIPLLTPEQLAALDDFDEAITRRIAFEKALRRLRSLLWY